MDTNTTIIHPLRYSGEFKQQHVSQWLISGQSKQIYSAAQGIKYGTFKSWVKQYREPQSMVAKESVSNFVSLDVKSSPVTNAGYAEIHYPNGSKLIIHQPIPIEELRRLLS